MPIRETLTRKSAESAKPRAKPYRLWDDKVPGLFLRVQPSGAKTYNVQWSRSSSRSLGKAGALTLDGARKRARAILSETDEHGAPLAVIEARQPAPADADTVAATCRDYVAALRKEGRDTAAADADRRFERTVYGDRLGGIRLDALTQDDVEEWRDRVERGDLPDLPAKKGRSPKPKPLSKSSVNRMRTPLVAALNRAVARRRVTQDRTIEWESVKPYEAAGQRRDLYLDREQRRALLAHSGADLRDLMECIALTGCRPGDPAAALRKDYDAKHGAVTFRTKGHTRTIPLSPAARALLDRLAKGKLPRAYLFTNGGTPWQAQDWRGPVKEAAAAAGLPPETVLYTLRHSWITDAIVGGLDLLTVAKLSGTSLAMIEKHYGHLVHGAARDKLAQVSFL